MRFFKIVNIIAIVLMLALWIVLYCFRENYLGSGLKTPIGIHNTGYHFTKSNPYGFSFRNKYFGFYTSTDNIVSEIWELNADSAFVVYHKLKGSKIKKVESVLMKSDSSVVITGSSDSLISVVSFDSTVSEIVSFTAPAKIKAVDFPNNNIEIVFGRKGKNVGHIINVTDSVKKRSYDLPNFFNRICEIDFAFVEKNRWKFVLQTNYHQKNDVWVTMDSRDKCNHLIFDERAVYPDYLGVVNIKPKLAAKLMDKTGCGLVPTLPINDSILSYRNRKMHLKKVPYNKNTFAAWAILTPDTCYWNILSQNKGELISNEYLSDNVFKLPCVVDDKCFNIVMPNDIDEKQIIMSKGEHPMVMTTDGDGFILITDKLNFSQLNIDGIIKSRKNFISLLSSTINTLYPNTIQFLEVNFPQYRALMYYVVLYSLFPLWVLSFALIWLINAIKKKPLYTVRQSKKMTAMQQFAIGSAVYIVVYAIYVVGILIDFNIFR